MSTRTPRKPTRKRKPAPPPDDNEMRVARVEVLRLLDRIIDLGTPARIEIKVEVACWPESPPFEGEARLRIDTLAEKLTTMSTAVRRGFGLARGPR